MGGNRTAPCGRWHRQRIERPPRCGLRLLEIPARPNAADRRSGLPLECALTEQSTSKRGIDRPLAASICPSIAGSVRRLHIFKWTHRLASVRSRWSSAHFHRLFPARDPRKPLHPRPEHFKKPSVTHRTRAELLGSRRAPPQTAAGGLGRYLSAASRREGTSSATGFNQKTST